MLSENEYFSRLHDGYQLNWFVSTCISVENKENEDCRKYNGLGILKFLMEFLNLYFYGLFYYNGPTKLIVNCADYFDCRLVNVSDHMKQGNFKIFYNNRFAIHCITGILTLVLMMVSD